MTDPIPPWPGRLVRMPAGDEVFVRTASARPDAQPALLVHGLGGSSLNWTDLMAKLRDPPPDSAAPALACDAVDLPGFGYSPPPAGCEYSVGALAAAVIALLDLQGRWPVHLIGNSLGGAVCTRVAARRPDLVRTLTLISPALPDLTPRPIPLRALGLCVPKLGRFFLDRYQRLPAQDRCLWSLREIYADPDLVAPARREEEIAELARRDGLGYATDVLYWTTRAIISEYFRHGRSSLWRDAARVTAPTLVIHGSHDRLVNPAMAAKAARVFHGARVVVLPRVGHVAMMERPDWVAREMWMLLAGPAATAGEPARAAS
jgi:pimeloyl-ACP methyl ester carboxylesterase